MSDYCQCQYCINQRTHEFWTSRRGRTLIALNWFFGDSLITYIIGFVLGLMLGILL